ncbi:EpsG family protein [Bifidobacterium felsineum]|uniref:EpsG family protein n=1 Tax=Bifidobacterium felsineum TaxID=2045440 RepID=A0A2M9HHU9_9BIFI|nr:EpsG family protein [Bifidobacterium felsineum]PJM76394.1 hypothetical protein CSQ86_09495 [Bifidobacterium felsineum]
MTIYIFELILILSFAFIAKDLVFKKYILPFIFIFFSLVAGFRSSSVGEDTYHYIDVYDKISQTSLINIKFHGIDVVYDTLYGNDLRIEIGYFLLCKIVHMMFTDVHFLFVVVALITGLLFYKFIKDNSLNIYMSTYVFLCESMYMQSFNLMRQMLSISIALQGYKYIRSNRLKEAIAIILLASLFHSSTIVLLIIVPLAFIAKTKNPITFLVSTFLLFIFLLPVLGFLITKYFPRYVSYFSNNYWMTDYGPGTILLWFAELTLCIYLITCYKKNRIKEENSEVLIIVMMIILYIGLSILGYSISAFERLALPFRAFLILFFPLSFNYINFLKPFFECILYLILGILFIKYSLTPTRIYTPFWK